MGFLKKGFPERDELVLCTVKRVEPHSAFVDLDEYSHVEGMLHVSEIALRGVKDIRDHLSVGKKIVCKVLSSREGEVDVSLKRVNSGARKQKLNESRVENRFYHLIEHACIEAGNKELTDKLISAFVNKYGSVYNSFEALRDKGLKILEGISMPEGVGSKITESFESLLKQLSVSIKRTVSVSSKMSNGIELIKDLLTSFNKPKEINVDMSYIGSGKFLMSIEAVNYKVAEEYASKLAKELALKGSSIGVMVNISE